jgi:hypothetical protein
MLQGNIFQFLQQEFRDGYLLMPPEEFCSVAFLEHLVGFIEAEAGARCPRCDAVVSDYSRQIANLQRWVRWLLPRRRGGRP